MVLSNNTIGCLCCEGVEGEIPDNHVAVKVFFEYFYKGIDQNSGSEGEPPRDVAIAPAH